MILLLLPCARAWADCIKIITTGHFNIYSPNTVYIKMACNKYLSILVNSLKILIVHVIMCTIGFLSHFMHKVSVANRN